MGRGGRGVIAAIEAIHREELALEPWLGAVLEEARGELDGGIGMLAWTFDATKPDAMGITARASIDCSDAFFAAAHRFNRAARDLFPTFVARSGFSSLSDRMGARWAEVEAIVGLEPGFTEVRDALELIWVDPIRPAGIALTAFKRSVGPVPRQLARRWGRVTAHLGAAFRRRSRPGAPHDEAVLRPDGRVEHAEGEALPAEARSALRDAARATDRARCALRGRDLDEAVEAWRALVAGRWSLIDRFESDGRRYVVARVNPIGATTPIGLSARERDVVRMRASAESLKNIAYELGLGVSTVSGDLRAAVAKLGLRSTAELIALANALAAREAGAGPAGDGNP